MFASGKTAAVASAANYVEEVFSTYLYTGNSSSQTITNNIDLSTYGGLVWTKKRNSSTTSDHFLMDTARGTQYALYSNSTTQQLDFNGIGVTAYNTNGYNLGGNTRVNGSGLNYVGWTFRKQPKFFDVVTYTGTGSVQNISHNLGSAPACMIVKDTTNAGSAWAIYHTSLGNTQYLQFTTSAAGTSSGYWNNTSPTSTQFTVGTNGNVNQSGATYVAYLFAHNAGGFGLTGTDNVISCGGWTAASPPSGGFVNLGYEPQWIMFRRTDMADNWYMYDNMRGWPAGGPSVGPTVPQSIFANTSGAEIASNSDTPVITPTGFYVNTDWTANNFIYIAIRRGPMKVPTSGTSVFTPVLNTGNNTAKTLTTNFVTDLTISQGRNLGSGSRATWWDRLRGSLLGLQSVNTSVETSYTATLTGFDNNTGVVVGVDTTYGYINNSPDTFATWQFRRAPSFFDEVCYTGTGVTHTETHNLGVAPELIIVKRRASATASWAVYAAPLTASYVGFLDLTNAFQADNMWNSTAPTSTAFTVRAANAQVNASGSTYVAYLFATCAGVSKVGSYTGTGTTKQIDCGFTGGARFVLIKRTDSTGDWYVWDSARGIVSGNDPYLLLNSTAAETTGTDYIDPYSAGFEISSTAPAAINASGGTFIFLAIA